MIEITANKNVDGEDRSATIVADVGDNCQDAIAKFGEEVVYTNYKRAVIITAQAAIRRFLETGTSQDEITNKMAGWKPGVALDRSVDPIEAIKNRTKDMTQEEKEEMARKLGLI